MKYNLLPSGLHAVPFDVVTSWITTSHDQSASTRYRAPAPDAKSNAVVPERSRPAGSHFASFMRFASFSRSTGTRTSNPSPVSDTTAIPSRTASTSPPLCRGMTAPTSWPTANVLTPPPARSYRKTVPAVRSTNQREFVRSSQCGPSPTSARTSTATSTRWLSEPITPHMGAGPTVMLCPPPVTVRRATQVDVHESPARRRIEPRPGGYTYPGQQPGPPHAPGAPREGPA